MKKIIVEVDYEVTAKRFITKKVDADSIKEAEEKVQKMIEGQEGCKVISMNSKEVKYKTKDWQDVEDIIFMYDEWIKEEKEQGDKDMADMHIEDRADWQYILDMLVKKEFKKAGEKYSYLDTSVRERCPDRVYNLFDSLGVI